ncbi:peroxisomal membrane protein 11C-like [Ostrea edulis]|uniref:peroxisomal membrane protein 11C-like n=1 Tax=Ostrea edulis TaxID=37623 RepID=UPI0024AFADB5|nr:peroxisomal membrane protein 11C-like [Ostrea edulis]
MEIVRVLESYRGRDKIVRLCTYAVMCIGGRGQADFSKRLLAISEGLGRARTTMRLFDDLSMLFKTRSYGTGAQDKNPIVRLMTLITNISYQIFYPMEHIYWLADRQVLPSFTPWKWMVGSIVAWAVALSADIIKMIAKIVTLRKELSELRKEKLLQSSEESEDHVRAERKSAVIGEIRESYLTLIQDLADFANAISWLPSGSLLWSGKLSRFQNGIFGMISSCILLYKAWPSKEKSS